MLNPSAPRIRAEPPKSPRGHRRTTRTEYPHASRAQVGRALRRDPFFSDECEAYLPCARRRRLNTLLSHILCGLLDPAGVSCCFQSNKTGRIKEPLHFLSATFVFQSQRVFFFVFVLIVVFCIFELEGNTEIIAKGK